MRRWLTLLVFLLWPSASWAANCTITGKVLTPGGQPIMNGTVNFDSIVQQTFQGGVTIPRLQITTTTDSTGNMKAMAIVQGLQGQFVFCDPKSGGCGNPTPVLIPVAPSADIAQILIGIQLSSGGNIDASNLNVSGNAAIGGTLDVTGLATLNGGLDVNGPSILNGTLNVSGATQLGVLTASSITTASLALTGAGNVLTFPNGTLGSAGLHLTSGGITLDNGNISVTGGISATGDISARNITASGLLTTGGGLNVTGNITQGGGNFQTNGWLGVGAAPGTQLDVQFNQNASTEGRIYNNNGGPSAAAFWDASNGSCETQVGTFGVNATPSGSIFYSGNRNFLIGGCPNGLLVQASGSNANLYLSAPNGNNVIVLGNQHLVMSNNGVSRPSLQNCPGGSMWPSATDQAGYVNLSQGVNSCQVVFSAGWPNTPSCFCNSEDIGTWCVANNSGSGITMTFGTLVSGWINWGCIGTL